jgi:phosphohistidine phosphatase SixA
MRPWILLLLLAACSSDPAPVTPDASDPTPDASVPDASDPMPDASVSTKVVFVVRHAETTTDPNDPPLSAAGQARAAVLAQIVAPAGLGAVLSSQFRRTRETGTPAAAAASLTVEVISVTAANIATYGALQATTARNHAARTVLVVGHSNTVPATVEALTGTTVPPIAETEYNRLYKVTLDATGAHLEMSTYEP